MDTKTKYFINKIKNDRKEVFEMIRHIWCADLFLILKINYKFNRIDIEIIYFLKQVSTVFELGKNNYKQYTVVIYFQGGI